MASEKTVEIPLNKCVLHLNQEEGVMNLVCSQKKSKSSAKDCNIIVELPFSVKKQQEDEEKQ